MTLYQHRRLFAFRRRKLRRKRRIIYALPAPASIEDCRPDEGKAAMTEDLKGSEQVLLHAEKDLTTKVEHDASHWVGHDETTTVDHDRTEHVKHD
jgi:hypothetical protein